MVVTHTEEYAGKSDRIHEINCSENEFVTVYIHVLRVDIPTSSGTNHSCSLIQIRVLT